MSGKDITKGTFTQTKDITKGLVGEKGQSQSSTFWHIPQKRGFHFHIRKFQNLIERIWPPIKLFVNSLSSRILYNKYFSSFDFSKDLFTKKSTWIFSHVHTPLCTRLYNPLCPSVRPSVRQTLLFFSDYTWLLHYCSCPNALIAFFITALAQQHKTKVAFWFIMILCWIN